MNKKIMFIISLFMMLSFSTGIFVAVMTQSSISFSTSAPTFIQSLFNSLQNDIFFVLLSLFFAVSIYLLPCMVVFTLCKTFSLGFSAVCLLSCRQEGLHLLLAVLLPRCLLRLPTYVIMMLLAIETAMQCKTLYQQSKREWKKNIMTTCKSYILCLFLLMLSSLIEVVLLQAVL